MQKPKKGEIIELEVDSTAYEGFGVARINELVCFVRGGLPGDRLTAQVVKTKANYIEAIAKEILKPSPNRIEPPCKYFGTCGGCSWQHLEYAEQLTWKRLHIIDSLKRIGHIEDAEVLPVIGSPLLYNYRNKMEFSFGAKRWFMDFESGIIFDEKDAHFALGLHIPGRYDRILNVDTCLIQPASGNAILQEVQRLAKLTGTTAYDQKTKSGYLRQLFIRNSHSRNETMVILVTNEPATEEDEDFRNRFCNEFVETLPEDTTVVLAINPTINQVTITESKVIAGKGYITESILGIDYKISPFSFFQTNSSQLDQFVGKILECAVLDSNKAVWDLYCGTGSITLPASRHCKSIYGMELVESSISDAKMNMELNNIGNAQFSCIDLHDKNIKQYLESLPKPDVIILDPPRAGLHKNLINTLFAINAPLIVYVSCNPAALARDAATLKDFYTLKTVQPFDMFPQTYHIEAVCVLESKYR
jgi:23S rRNA (uracil1939-C5)-methyltransferase